MTTTNQSMDDLERFLAGFEVGHVITAEDVEKMKEFKEQWAREKMAAATTSLTFQFDFSDRKKIAYSSTDHIFSLITMVSGSNKKTSFGCISLVFVAMVAYRPVYLKETNSCIELFKQCLTNDSKLRNVARTFAYLVIFLIRIGLFFYVLTARHRGHTYTFDLTCLPAVAENLVVFAELFMKKTGMIPAVLGLSVVQRCNLGGLTTYVTGPRDSKRAIILVSDIFGVKDLKLTSNAEDSPLRKLANEIANSGFLVVVPDVLHGDPINDTRGPQGHRISTEWLHAHNPDKICEDLMQVVADLEKQGVCSIGAAGFCWGGCALAAKQVDNFLRIYPGVDHGWILMHDDTDQLAVKMAEKAHTDMLHWLTEYVK
ncbi:hypothetical protein ACH5RR_027372 [Cinchona calisaya]|uniref:Dienelactone hydrolase domain-containing protein n=1 Tax=Cinchona calisaya TaxID=153742 RepID=A0ABD2Z5B3_9GENT